MIRVAITFVIVLITWVFFRAENFEVAWRYLGAMFGMSVATRRPRRKC